MIKIVKNGLGLVFLTLAVSAISYADCTKEEVRKYILEGLDTDQINLICHVSAPSSLSGDQMCCCIQVTEEKSKERSYSTRQAHANYESPDKEWTTLGEDHQILPIDQCGTTEFQDRWTRTRSFCRKTSFCSGK